MIKMTKRLAIFGVAVAALGFAAQDAHATYSCTNGTYGVGSTYTGSYDTLCTGNNTANQSSTVATSAAVLKTAVSQSARMVSGRVSAALSGNDSVAVASNGFSASTGMAAGDGSNRTGAWVAGSWSSVEDNNTATEFDGDVYTGFVGIDYKVTPRAVLGISVGYESIDIDTVYNGFNGQDGNLDGDGYTVAPYVGFSLTDNIQASLTAGYSDIDYDTLRYDPNTGNSITGSTDAERYFVNAGIAGSHVYRNNWHFRGSGSVFYANEEKDAFTETESNAATIAVADEDTDFGQVVVDARLGYLFQHVEPYALVGAEFDITKDEGVVAAGQTSSMEDDFGARFGGGLNLRLGPNVVGGIEAYTVEFRDDYEEYTGTASLRVSF
jgi:hypothetical protein